MNKHSLRALLAALTLVLLLTACGQQQNTPAGSDAAPPAEETASPGAQARTLYKDFFTGSVSVTANLINAGVDASTASFRAPDIYAAKGADGSDMDWTVERFALLDMDGDSADELVLNVSFSGSEEYVILTCHNGAVYANQVVYRGFLLPKADGTFEWSNGAFDNGAARARFDRGVLIYDDFASMLESSSGNAAYMLNGESVDEDSYNTFLDEQSAKNDLAWTAFTLDALNSALAQ